MSHADVRVASGSLVANVQTHSLHQFGYHSGLRSGFGLFGALSVVGIAIRRICANGGTHHLRVTHHFPAAVCHALLGAVRVGVAYAQTYQHTDWEAE